MNEVSAVPSSSLQSGDLSGASLLKLALLGQLLIVLCAVRHEFVYGGSNHWALNVAEAIVFVVGTICGGIALARVARQAGSLELRFLVRSGALLTFVAMLAPAFLSNDIWDYLARGRVEVLGSNPYVTSPELLRGVPAMDSFLGPELAKWPKWVMPYGPIAAALQWLCALPDSPWVGAYLWKLLMALSHLGTSLVIYKTIQLSATERQARSGLVLWLWNPWLLLECCGSAHNDALVAFGLAVMCYGVVRSRYGLGAVGYGLGMLVKHGSPVILPVLFCAAWRRRRLAGFAVGSSVILLLVAGCYAHYWSVVGGLDWILNQDSVARGSVPSLVGGYLGASVGSALRLVGALGSLCIVILAIRRTNSAQAFARLALSAMVVFVMLFVPNFAPWYHLWWLPLIALCNLSAMYRVLQILGWTGPLSYLVLVTTHDFGEVHELWALLCAGLLPMLFVLRNWRSLLAVQSEQVDASSSF